MRVLTFADWYLPGFRAGGPIRSISNMVEALGDEFQFRIITRDRDWQQSTAYPEMVSGVWRRVGKGEVLYLTPSDLSWARMSELIGAANPDLFYFNSLFSPRFSILPRLLRKTGRIPRLPVVLAPRGELSPGALGLKKSKKRVALAATKSLGLCRDVVWQASTEDEASNIRCWFGIDAEVIVAPNVPPQISALNGSQPRRDKIAGQLRVLFLARISRSKNLDGALTMLRGLKGDLQMDIYGPLEDRDRDYLAECQKLMAQLPVNIKVQYLGDVEHHKVSSVMKLYDLFFLPTLGENFGHVIPEALLSGCPVLISDQTPWRDLEARGVGWALPLSEPEKFQAVLEECTAMGTEEHRQLSAAAVKYGRQVASDEKIISQNRKLLLQAFARGATSERAINRK